jgi:hypothetical protein
VARPTVLTDDVIERILDLQGQGWPAYQAAEFAGISGRTWKRYVARCRQTGTPLVIAYREPTAEEQAELDALLDSMNGQIRTLLQELERGAP